MSVEAQDAPRGSLSRYCLQGLLLLLAFMLGRATKAEDCVRPVQAAATAAPPVAASSPPPAPLPPAASSPPSPPRTPGPLPPAAAQPLAAAAQPPAAAAQPQPSSLAHSAPRRRVPGTGPSGTHPFQSLPIYMRTKFRMDGRAIVACQQGNGKDILIKEEEVAPGGWTGPRRPQVYVDAVREALAKRANVPGHLFGYGSYQNHAMRLVAANRHLFEGKEVLIPGSETPAFEAIALEAGGARSVVTLDYRNREIDTGGLNISFATVDDFWKRPRKFSAAVAWSNFEHDGLGRYGDRIDPDGDMKAMEELSSLLHPGGIVLFSVPMGCDCVAYNKHRVYGRLRLPLLLKRWRIRGHAGLPSDASGSCSGTTNPSLLLENTPPQDPAEELRKLPTKWWRDGAEGDERAVILCRHYFKKKKKFLECRG